PSAAIDDAVTLADLDGDGDLDVIEAGKTSMRLLRNDRGRFAAVNGEWLGTAFDPPSRGAIAGDYDNDGRADFLMLPTEGVRLYRQTAPAAFTNVTAVAELDTLRGMSMGRA